MPRGITVPYICIDVHLKDLMGYFRWTYHEGIVRFKIRRVPIEHSSGALLEMCYMCAFCSISMYIDILGVPCSLARFSRLLIFWVAIACRDFVTTYRSYYEKKISLWNNTFDAYATKLYTMRAIVALVRLRKCVDIFTGTPYKFDERKKLVDR